jgi:hypothetical protein
MHWLPLGEAFVAMHLFYYVFPCLQGRTDWLAISQAGHLLALTGVGIFLAAFLAAYHFCLPRQHLALPSIGVTQRVVNASIVWGIFWLWLTWSVVVQSGWLPSIGNLLNVFRSAATASGSMAAVFLFYQSGRKRLKPNARVFLLAGFGIGLAINFASGFLIGGAELMGAALLAFSLGRKRLPAGATILALAVLAVLQLGKGEYRARFWGENTNYSLRAVGLVEGYSAWLTASWHALNRGKQENDEPVGFLERTSLIQILARAMEVVPAQERFLKGETYAMLPELMVPRIFWPQKPRGTLPSETMGVHIGIQTEEGTNFTGVSVGQVAEGWINFGWFGLVLAGAFLGVLYGLPARLSRELAPNQAGWLLAAVFLIFSVNLENSVVEVLCSLITALIMGVALLLAVSGETIIGPRSKRRTTSSVADGRGGIAAPSQSKDVPDAKESVGGSR